MSFKQTIRSINTSKTKPKIKYNMEMIDYQVDPSFISKLESKIAAIVETVMPGNVNLVRKKNIAPIEELEALLTARFGVQFVAGYNDGLGAFCLVSGSKGKFMHNDYFNYHDINKELEHLKNTRPEDFEKIVKNETVDPDTRFSPGKYWKGDANGSMFSFLNAAKEDGVELDLKRAKIVKAPKGMKFYISIDWYSLGHTYKMSEREIAAVMLHEIGHCWTHIEYAYKVFSSVQILSDVIREEYSKRNKTPTDAIKIFYNKTKLEQTKTSGRSLTEVTIVAYTDILRGSTQGLYGNHSTIDSEQQADEFSSRFGLGGDLSSALDKLGLSSWYDRSLDPFYATSIFLPFIACVTASIAIQAPLIGLAAGGLGALMLFALGGYTLSILYDKDYPITYDDAYRRYKRIRNATIRRLNTVTDNEVRSEVLHQIDVIDKIYVDIKRDTDSSFFKKLSNFFHSGKRAYDETVVDEIIEDLTANELILASARWNTKTK